MKTEVDRADRAALGQKLARLREAAGYVQQQFAELVSYSRSTIANVETGRQRMPRSFWQRCDSVLGSGTTLLAIYDRVAAARQRGSAQIVPGPRWPGTQDREAGDRSFLTLTQLLASQRQAVAPLALLALVDAHRNTLTTIFNKINQVDPVRSDIAAIIGETSIVASRLYSALGKRAQAIAYCAHARQLADDFHNPVLGATARIFESNLRSDAATLIGAGGDMAVGLRMLDEAAAFGHLLSPAARARIAAEQAQILAQLNLRQDCLHALDRARQAVDHIDANDQIGLFSDWNSTRIRVYEGTCWLFLGEPTKSAGLLTEAVRELENDPDNRNVLLAAQVDLSSAHAASGNLEEGCRTLGDAYTRLLKIGNRRGIERALGARRRLSRWDGEREVADLDERLRDALTAAPAT